MNYKEFFLDFVQFAFLVMLISVSIVFFLDADSDRLQNFIAFLRSIIPISYFGIVFIISLKIFRNRYLRRKDDNELDIVISLNIKDKLIAEIAVFLVPLSILTLALAEGKTHTEDILQAVVAFIIVFALIRFIFSKEKK